MGKTKNLSSPTVRDRSQLKSPIVAALRVVVPISSMLATDTCLAPPLARGAGGVEVWHLKRKLVLLGDEVKIIDCDS